MPELRHVAVGADRDLMARPPCAADADSPARRSKPSTAGSGRPSASAAATMARAIGMLRLRLDRRDQRPAPRPRSKPSASVEVGQRRAALRQRAGLVERDDLARPAAPAAPRPCGTGRPAPPPRPVPTMIEVGVASPMAQGQAMISTATALTSAEGQRRVGPEDEPDARRSAPPAAITAGTNHSGDPVDQRLDRQLAALRLLDHADDLRQHRVRAHRRGAEGEARRSC